MARVSSEDIRRYLTGLLYPATPETVVEQARGNGAPPEVVRSLERMPPGEWHSLDRVVQVWETAVARREPDPDRAP